MSKHVMEHPDSPTWCVLCGTFDMYCASVECRPSPERDRWWTKAWGAASERAAEEGKVPAQEDVTIPQKALAHKEEDEKA